MLTLTRRVGQSIYIDNAICITVYDRLRYHTTIAVLSPANAEIKLGGAIIRPAILAGGERFYLLTLLSGDDFTIDEVRIAVRFRPTLLSVQSLQKRQMKISIDAPKSRLVQREEVHFQKSGKKTSAMSTATWLYCANRAVSSQISAYPVHA